MALAPSSTADPSPTSSACPTATPTYPPRNTRPATIVAGSIFGTFGLYFLLMLISFMVILSRRKQGPGAAPSSISKQLLPSMSSYDAIHARDALDDTTTNGTNSDPTPPEGPTRRTSSTANLTVYVPAHQHTRSASSGSVNLIPLRTASSSSSMYGEESLSEADSTVRPQRSRASSTTARYYYPEDHVEDARNSVVVR